MKKTAIYPGTFDPITYGHIDVIKKSLKIVDSLVVGVSEVGQKNYLFSIDERIQIVEQALYSDLKFKRNKIKIIKFKSLTTSLCNKYRSNIILRGLRAVSDFEYEFQLAGMNRKLNNKIEYKYIPIQSVGIYVPHNLPSTLLMNAILAKKIAGVKRVVLANPRLNGKLNPAVMYAAKKCGISEIISVGGSQAIASLAYIQKVNKIVGPGNDYVARAKKEVFGDVGIEGIAGPSEITVVADKNTNLKEVLTSLIGQAEHDTNSQCILIVNNQDFIKSLKKVLKQELNKIPRKNIAKKSLIKNGLILRVYNNTQIIDSINEIAPEHLELNLYNYKNLINRIKNAGSICIGRYSAMAVTDYNVGTNHVLPTLGSAKFSSGLNVSEFYKKTSHIKLSKKGIEVIGKKAITLAEYEGLFGHAQSIKSRIRR